LNIKIGPDTVYETLVTRENIPYDGEFMLQRIGDDILVFVDQKTGRCMDYSIVQQYIVAKEKPEQPQPQPE